MSPALVDASMGTTPVVIETLVHVQTRLPLERVSRGTVADETSSGVLATVGAAAVSHGALVDVLAGLVRGFQVQTRGAETLETTHEIPADVAATAVTHRALVDVLAGLTVLGQAHANGTLASGALRVEQADVGAAAVVHLECEIISL